MKAHLIIHSGEKPFKCDLCEQKFTKKAYLKSHLKIHTGEKPFKCEYCETEFTEKCNLKKHISRIHTK